jgi:hypothetical protein
LPHGRAGYQRRMTYEQIQTELEELERRGWDSLCEGTADEFYGSVMTEDAVMVLANGMTMDRDDVVEALRGAPTWDRYEIADIRVVPIEPDAAALVYKGTAFRGEAVPVVAVMSSVYRRNGHGWKLALYQQTPIPET